MLKCHLSCDFFKRTCSRILGRTVPTLKVLDCALFIGIEDVSQYFKKSSLFSHFVAII